MAGYASPTSFNAKVWVNNTFLEFGHAANEQDNEEDDADLWTIGLRVPARQCTDSVLDRVSNSRVERSINGTCITVDMDKCLEQTSRSRVSTASTASTPDQQQYQHSNPQYQHQADCQIWQGEPEWAGIECPYAQAGFYPQQLYEPETAEPVARMASSTFQSKGAGHTGPGEDDDDDEGSDEADQNAIMEVTAAVAGRRALMQRLVDPAESSELQDTWSGLNGRTTVMMRNIPCKYTPQKVMKEINQAGFLGRYDFFYLPMDPRSRSNRGFAFVNLDSAAASEEFFQTFSNQKLRRFNSDKVISVMPADLQGFEKNAYHFATSLKLRRKRNTESGPLFFRSLPAGLRNEAALASAVPEPEPGDASAQDQYRAEEYQTYSQAWLPSQPQGVPTGEQWPSQSAPPGEQWPNLPAAAQQGQTEIPSNRRRGLCGCCGQPRPPRHLFCTFCGNKAKR